MNKEMKDKITFGMKICGQVKTALTNKNGYDVLETTQTWDGFKMKVRDIFDNRYEVDIVVKPQGPSITRGLEDKDL